MKEKIVKKKSIADYRKDFPILCKKLSNGKRLSYLDNGATTQKPQIVIDALTEYYQNHNANVHRGIHKLSEDSTVMYEQARSRLAAFINASSPKEIVFVKGCTEAINLVAQSFLAPKLQPGDNIVLTVMEHHANIVPWQMVAKAHGASLKIIPIDEKGNLKIDGLEQILSKKTKMLAFSHVSNVLGSLSPAKTMIQQAKALDIPVLVDGAQAASHMPIDVQDLGADFYTFSAHKTFGPTGLGVLYGRYKHLDNMQPYQTGGGMIEKVSFDDTSFAIAPYKFEAGTPNIAGAIATGVACEYIKTVGYEQIIAHEKHLSKALADVLAEFPEVQVYGQTADKLPIASFTMKDIHAHDIATILDSDGVAIRAGHHCTMPLMKSLGVNATTRASLAFYNNDQDLEALAKGLHKVKKVFYG